MPPVRWKLLTVVAICVAHISSTAKTGRELIEDGWKPITRPRESNYNEKITEYRFPFNTVESAKQEFPSNAQTKSPQPKPTASTPISNINNQHHGQTHHIGKVPPHIKHYVTNQGHGAQISLNYMNQRNQNKPYKIPVPSKSYGHVPMNGKRPLKPVRVQAAAHSQRDEIFVPAPSTGIGNYAYFNQGQSPLTTRLNQPHAHLDFSNHFGQHDNIFQFQRPPTQQYVLPKYPLQNDVHYTFHAQNDEYTRNLVPPPKFTQFLNNEKQKGKHTFKQNDQTNEQEQVKKHKTEQIQIPGSILVQVAPSQQQSYYIPNQHDAQTDVQVTKEKLTEIHNNIRPNYKTQDNVNYGNFQFGKKPTEAPELPTYEVTEEKSWHYTSPFQQEAPFQSLYTNRGSIRAKHPQIQVEDFQTFLPTPIKPEGLIPTSPTQSEVSTIFTELSQKINQQNAQLDHSLYNVKEVSTHFPILGQPDFKQFNVEYKIAAQANPVHLDETSTKIDQHINSFSEEEVVGTTSTDPPITTVPTRDWQQKRKPNHKRRRPINHIRLSTTEEPVAISEQYELQKSQEDEPVLRRQKPQRRRPLHRTTEATIEDRPVRKRYRQKPKPTLEVMEDDEMPYNHKTSQNVYHKPTRGNNQKEQYEESTDNFRKLPNRKNNFERYESYGNNDEDEKQNKEIAQSNDSKNYENPVQMDQSSEQYDEMYSEEKSGEQKLITDVDNENLNNIKTSENGRPTIVTTEQSPGSNIHTPENEIDYSTKDSIDNSQHETITIKEVYTNQPENNDETTLATMTTTTTSTTSTPETTTTTTTTKRLKRPLHYNSERPRFSIKDYRQRLNRYTSTTESPKSTTEAPRTRFPHRSRKPTRTQEQKIENEENNSELHRTKFVPKEPRYSNTKAMETTEKTIKTSNSRLRPFGRYHSTTTEFTTPKVSIKSNLFNNSRRPPQLSLKTRIYNRYHRNNTSETKTKVPELENLDKETSDMVQLTEEYPKSTTETFTQTENKNFETTSEQITTISAEEINEMEILKNDAFLQSQRVSDLTSSAQNDYNTPGVFKSVSPNVRRVPSFFTIATDNPILPIEAFFPNINKEKH